MLKRPWSRGTRTLERGFFWHTMDLEYVKLYTTNLINTQPFARFRDRGWLSTDTAC